MIELPIINYKGKKYFFDYRLKQLREVDNYSQTIKFIDLSSDEAELLFYALKTNKPKIIKINMEEIEHKL